MTTFIISALSGQVAPGNKYKLVLNDQQVLDLKEQLDMAITANNKQPMDKEMQDARCYFFEEEGYMGTDMQCWNYWKDRHND